MGQFITTDDLAAFATIDEAKADAMVEDAEALAMLVAPCLGDFERTLTDAQVGAVRAILRGALLRWNDSGTGAVQQQSAGPFGQTLTTPQRKSVFWPSEIEQLQQICGGKGSSGAWSIDTAPALGGLHSPICSLMFGALYCSCGADISGGAGPLYEDMD